MLQRAVLRASRSDRLRAVVQRAPVSRDVVRRFVAGADADAAFRVATELAGQGLAVTLDHLGEDTTDAGQARAARDAYLEVLRRLAAAGLTEGGRAEVSVKLSALGQAVDPELALGHARDIAVAAAAAGTTVTVDMEDHRTTDDTLAAVRALRAEHPSAGAVVQSYLHRTEEDCRALAAEGSRVRLVKGAYDEPAEVAYQEREEVSASFRRCLDVLMAGPGYPMVGTHDPELLEYAVRQARELGRGPGDHEYQLLYGVRPVEQRRLAAEGHLVRVYVPYGQQWYPYLMRRLAERPANLGFFLRALVSRS